jgi:hypothetical protein
MAGSKNHSDGARGGAKHSRRGLLAGAAGALGVLAAESVVTAQPAQATQGNPVLLGTDNTGATARTELATATGESAILADASSGSGVQGFATGAGTGVNGTGGASNGPGVQGTGGGTGNGVSGFGGSGGGNGVEGQAGSAAGAGVLAFNGFGGTALQVNGIAAFRRSGLFTVAAGSSSGTVFGVTLSSASLVLATLQQDRAGVWVRSVVPNTAPGAFTIHLNKAVTASITVAWFVVN